MYTKSTALGFHHQITGSTAKGPFYSFAQLGMHPDDIYFQVSLELTLGRCCPGLSGHMHHTIGPIEDQG